MCNTTHTQAGTLSHYNKAGNRILNHWRIQDAQRGIDIAKISLDVPIDERERTAAHIVRCVNSHDAMLAALKAALPIVESAYLDDFAAAKDMDMEESFSVLEQVKAAIAQAEGKI